MKSISKNKLKKVLCLAFAFILVFSQLSATGLATSETAMDVFNELMEYNMAKIEAGCQTAEPDSYELYLEQRLGDYGIEVLSQDELSDIVGKIADTSETRVIVPSTTSNVRWYSNIANAISRTYIDEYDMQCVGTSNGYLHSYGVDIPTLTMMGQAS